MTIKTVRFRQSGGFAGLIRGCEIRFADLKPSEKRTLEQLMRDSGLVGLETARQTQSATRDALQFQLDIEVDSKATRWQFDEDELTPPMTRLISFLQARATPTSL